MGSKLYTPELALPRIAFLFDDLDPDLLPFFLPIEHVKVVLQSNQRHRRTEAAFKNHCKVKLGL